MYVIDGNNVLHQAPRVLEGPAIGRVALCARIARWARSRGEAVTIVFDGPEPRAGVAQQMRGAGVAVVFGEARSADAVIEAMVEAAEQPASLVVVSSDKAIGHAARRRRARNVEAVAFLRDLAATERDAPATSKDTPPAPHPAEKPEGPDAGKIEDWLREFRLDEGADG
jgi:predicted RNA-binding protein with PIN domain